VLKLTPTGPTPVAAGSDAVAAKSDPQADADKQARSMDSLLDEALSPEARRQELAARRTEKAVQQELPLLPSRAQVTQAMTVLLPAIRGCAMGQSGLATATITVRNDGSVAATRITGAPFAGTASGRCMEGVLRRGKFPRFRQATFRVRYPLSIQ
jgi:hypothetical protein